MLEACLQRIPDRVFRTSVLEAACTCLNRLESTIRELFLFPRRLMAANILIFRTKSASGTGWLLVYASNRFFPPKQLELKRLGHE